MSGPVLGSVVSLARGEKKMLWYWHCLNTMLSPPPNSKVNEDRGCDMVTFVFPVYSTWHTAGARQFLSKLPHSRKCDFGCNFWRGGFMSE